MDLIDICRKKFYEKRHLNEIEFLNNSEHYNIFENATLCEQDKINRLEILNHLLKGDFNDTNFINNTKEEYFKEIDKYIYRKQWNKLNPQQKINKISQYLKSKNYDSVLSDSILKELSVLAHEGKINTKKNVVYDPNAEIILSIPILHIDSKGKNQYFIKQI